MSADCLLMTVTALQSLHLSAQAPAILSCFLVARFCKQDVALPGQSYPVALAAVRAVLHPDLRSSLGYQRHIFSGLQQHRRTRIKNMQTETLSSVVVVLNSQLRFLDLSFLQLYTPTSDRSHDTAAKRNTACETDRGQQERSVL